MNRAALFAAACIAISVPLAACSTAPQDMTVHGTVTLRPLNGIPPAQAYGSCCGIVTQVNITADDGPGNYSGQPWNETVTDMTLKSSTAKVMIWTFTAQVPDDAGSTRSPCRAARRRSKGRTSPWRRCSRVFAVHRGRLPAVGAQ